MLFNINSTIDVHSSETRRLVSRSIITASYQHSPQLSTAQSLSISAYSSLPHSTWRLFSISLISYSVTIFRDAVLNLVGSFPCLNGEECPVLERKRPGGKCPSTYMTLMTTWLVWCCYFITPTWPNDDQLTSQTSQSYCKLHPDFKMKFQLK